MNCVTDSWWLMATQELRNVQNQGFAAFATHQFKRGKIKTVGAINLARSFHMYVYRGYYMY
jgi:hypothetical protein